MEETRVALKTERLMLLAPTQKELAAAARDPAALPQRLRMEIQSGNDREFYKNKKTIYRAKSLLMETVGGDWPFCTAWQIARDGFLVGEAGFKGPPDESGELEIGYGLRKNQRGMGYMTEAVTALCRYAFADNRVSSVVAVTKWSNRASHRVLLRCGFRRDGFCGFHFLWRLTRR